MIPLVHVSLISITNQLSFLVSLLKAICHKLMPLEVIDAFEKLLWKMLKSRKMLTLCFHKLPSLIPIKYYLLVFVMNNAMQVLYVAISALSQVLQLVHSWNIKPMMKEVLNDSVLLLMISTLLVLVKMVPL